MSLAVTILLLAEKLVIEISAGTWTARIDRRPGKTYSRWQHDDKKYFYPCKCKAN